MTFRINKPVDCGLLALVKEEDLEELKKENKRLREALEEIAAASCKLGFYKVSSIEKVIKIVTKALLDVSGDKNVNKS